MNRQAARGTLSENISAPHRQLSARRTVESALGFRVGRKILDAHDYHHKLDVRREKVRMGWVVVVVVVMVVVNQQRIEARELIELGAGC